MGLQSIYQQFLAAPHASSLADNASLHYITTLTTLNGAAEIIKHLKGRDYDLKLKEEKFLDVVEAADAVAVEVSTTIEFLAGGGAYLPKLDDNFLADRTVTFPIIHIVSFDADGKITQIRQSWDQGSLLKLIDVIGKTGRNWPIRDGKDQIKLIANSVKSAGKTTVDAAGAHDVPEHIRSRGNSNHVTRDPHASLALFAPREKQQEPLPNVIAPKASAKPPQRAYKELFSAHDSDNSPTKETHERAESPSKNPRAPKVGAAKNYAPSRLFDTDEDGPAIDLSKEKVYRPNPARYQHFDWAEGGDDDAHAKSKPQKEVQAAKHSSQWNFDDFKTPQKVIPTKVLRTNEVRHWGNSDDENVNSPMLTKKVDKPRKDAETHFEFQDDGTPNAERRLVGRPRGEGQNNGLGLYKDNMFDDDEPTPVAGHASKASLANVRERGKVFDPHFTMTDDSPAGTPVAAHLPEDRAKAVKMMDANWSSYDQSPNQKENAPANGSRPSAGTTKNPLVESNRNENKGIVIAGDGMGGRKSTNTMSDRNANPKGIIIGGDGMGGKKGQGRQWGFGDDSDGEEEGGRNVQGKFHAGKSQKQQATGGDFWDF